MTKMFGLALGQGLGQARVLLGHDAIEGPEKLLDDAIEGPEKLLDDAIEGREKLLGLCGRHA